MHRTEQRPSRFMLLLLLLFGSVCSPSLVIPAGHPASSAAVQAGFEHILNRRYDAALASFEQALAANERDARAHLGLGITHYHLFNDLQAERELKRALELEPKVFSALHLLGEIAYRRDDADAAIGYWEQAAALDPANAVVLQRLDRVRRERSTERDFNRAVTSHFLTKYEGRERIEAGRIVLRILEDAYSEIGRELSCYPSREIQVILYSDRQYTEVTDAPGWSGGIYDGKIRIPVGGIERASPGLRDLLYHEYTHAVVHSITGRVPTWLNEGLAQHLAGRRIAPAQREVLRLLARTGKLPSLRQLEGPFVQYTGQDAAFAYVLSLSAVSYLTDRFGTYRIRSILDALADGASVDAAIGSGLLLSYDELQHQWKGSLE